MALTGAGDYFSSGNDLSNFIRPEVCQNVKDSNQLHLFFHGIYTLFSSFLMHYSPILFFIKVQNLSWEEAAELGASVFKVKSFLKK